MIHNISWHVLNLEDYLEQRLTPEQALQAFVLCELGFGAKIYDLDSHRVTVQTHVAGSSEFTIFHGPRAEMADLVDVAAWYLQVSQNCSDHLRDQLGLPDLGMQWPYYIASAPEDQYKETVLKLSLVAWMGEQPSPRLLRYTPKHLLDAQLLRRELNAPLVEVLI